MDQGFEHLQKEEWTEARRNFELELTTHPKNLEARYHLALLLSKAGHHDAEKELYLENMKLGWHLPSVVNLSAIYRSENNPAAARELLKRAAKHFRFEATPRYLLAEIDTEAGQILSADKWFRDALKCDPLNGYAHIRYAKFLAGQKKFGDALKHGERAAGLLPESALTLTVLGEIQVAAGKRDEALESYQKSLSLQPDPTTRQHLIDLLHDLGFHERANRMQQGLDAWLKHHEGS